MRLVDTSAWIHSLRPGGNSDVVSRVRSLLETGEAAWCPMVRLELWNGARGEHEKRVLKDMEQTLTELDMSRAVWADACKLARRARRRGKTAPATDILIVACAAHYGVEIEHDDEHFDTLKAL